MCSLLEKGIPNAHYECTLHPDYRQEAFWKTLAENKYGEIVAGILEAHEGKSPLLILPQMPEMHTILVELLENHC